MAIDKKVLNVPHLRFPEFTERWDTYRIADILCIGNGRDYKHLSKGDIPVFGTGGYMTSVNECLYEGETTFIGRKGTINKPFYYNGKFWTVDTLFYTHSFKRVIPKFVYCLFQTINWLRYNEASGVPSLSKDTIEKIKVRIPQLDEQKKIAKLLSLLDERIATQNKIIEDLKLLRDAISGLIFNSMKNEKTILLGNVACISNGSGDVQDSDSIKRDGWYPFFDRSEEQKWFPTYSFNREAIIYAGEGQNFFPRYYKGKFALHQRCYAITDFCECLLPKYCLYFMNTLNSYFIRNAVGSTVPSLRMDMFQKAKIKIPTIERQQEIVSTLDALSLKCENEEIVRALYNTQKSYLLQQLFI